MASAGDLLQKQRRHSEAALASLQSCCCWKPSEMHLFIDSSSQMINEGI